MLKNNLVAGLLGVGIVLSVASGVFVLGAAVYHVTPLPVATASTRPADNVFLTGLQYSTLVFGLIVISAVIQEEVLKN